MKKQEKAEALRLVNQYLPFVYENWEYTEDTLNDEKWILEDAKKIATMTINEILNSHYKVFTGANKSIVDFYEEVKEEIENYNGL